MSDVPALSFLNVAVVDRTEDVARVCRANPGSWIRFVFTKPKKNTKAALYGISRALKAEGVDAMVREQAGGHVLVAMAYQAEPSR